jgi:hypothetical protein
VDGRPLSLCFEASDSSSWLLKYTCGLQYGVHVLSFVDEFGLISFMKFRLQRR